MIGFTRRTRIGVALAPDRATAVLLGSPARPEEVRLTLPSGREDPTDVLTGAFRTLADRLERTHDTRMDSADVSVALLPPLADVRLLDLPPLRPSEAEAVVRRDAARHFLGSDGPRAVGVSTERGSAGVLAAASAIPLVEGVARAAARTGWRLATVVPAQAAWLAAARATVDGADTVTAVVVQGDTAHVLSVVGGDAVAPRRVPLRRDELAAALPDGYGGPVAVFGDADRIQAALEAVGAAGLTASAPGDEGTSAARTAAEYARGSRLELVTPGLAEQRRRRDRGLALRLAAAAVALVMVGAAVHLWGARREVQAVREQRSAIRDDVAPLLAARDSLDRMNEVIRAVGEAAAGTQPWTRALSEVALLLPRETHLTSLTASGDRIEFEAAGDRAGAAIQALRGARNLRDARLEGLVQRELENGETVVERFRLSARLSEPDPPETTGLGDGGVPASGLGGLPAYAGGGTAP